MTANRSVGAEVPKPRRPHRPLRRGWTTGACAAAAAKAAFEALLTGRFPDPVTIRLPGGERPSFALVGAALGPDSAQAGVVKDAGDDPDITHGATVRASVERTRNGGVQFRAGAGVGTVTKAGLPVPPGEPAINPGPRQMIAEALADVAEAHDAPLDVAVTISIPDGERMAQQTMNPRLGIVGGLSILGTTGVVIPYSCASWIHSIHRGIDVARAEGLTHLAGATGKVSEAAVQRLFGLPESALIDMGDFVGGMLKYLRRHPVPRISIAGGFGKLAKLAAGHLDLHSARSQVDTGFLAEIAASRSADPALCAEIRQAGSAAEVLSLVNGTGLELASAVAARARETALAAIGDDMDVDVLIFDRQGRLIGRSPDDSHLP